MASPVVDVVVQPHLVVQQLGDLLPRLHLAPENIFFHGLVTMIIIFAIIITASENISINDNLHNDNLRK